MRPVPVATAHGAFELHCRTPGRQDRDLGAHTAPDWVQQFISRTWFAAGEGHCQYDFLAEDFGRKAVHGLSDEAAIISKEMGAPVQVVWSWEDDMTQGPIVRASRTGARVLWRMERSGHEGQDGGSEHRPLERGSKDKPTTASRRDS